MSIVSKLKHRYAHYTWDLAFMEYDENIFHSDKHSYKLRIVKNPYKAKWFADPFILDVTDEAIILFVEEFDSTIKRGRIAKLTISRKDNRIVDCKILLDLDTHLSFPAIYRIGSDIFVNPENHASGNSFIYRYNIDEDKFERIESPLIPEPLSDNIVTKIGAVYYAFATLPPTPNGCEMVVYKSDNFFGKYFKVAIQTFDSSIARMAGMIQEVDGILIRPAQDCNEGYGRGIVFQEIRINTDGMSFNTIGSLYPNKVKYAGIHTYNSYNKQLVVIDLKRYDYPMIQKLYHLK